VIGRRRPPPLWFTLGCAAAWIALVHALGWHEAEAPVVTQAWIGFLLALAGWIWNGVEAVGQATIVWLTWAVGALWGAIQAAYNVFVGFGDAAMRGLRGAWQFFRWTYDAILKPAWLKFWSIVDRVRGTLEHVLRPVFRVLRAIRDEVLAIYRRYVQPVLDAIGIARQALRVLASLHLAWAQRLDAELGRLEELIDRPFRFVLAQINRVINVVNRIATADGLFQRLALVRSIERDIVYVQREFLNAWHRPLTDDERAAAAKAGKPKSLEQVTRDLHDYMQTGGGADAALIDEQVVQARIYFRAAGAARN